MVWLLLCQWFYTKVIILTSLIDKIKNRIIFMYKTFQKKELIINEAKSRINAFTRKLRNTMESYHSKLIYTKAHTYPVSVPEKWKKLDEKIVDWDIQLNKPLRLYVHIPWCLTKCIFCFYESKPNPPGDSEFQEYLSCLQKELSIYCNKLSTNRLKAEIMYFGGGTPSSLSPGQIKKLFETIYKFVDFTSDSFRITEISPGSITQDKLKAFVDGGIDRISMGVQCMNNNVLQKCKRDHDSDQVIRAYDLLRSENIPEINFDILLNLPEQTMQDFIYSVVKTIELSPSSISFLNLRIVPGSILFKQNSFKPSWEKSILMRAIYQHMLFSNKQYIRTRPHYYILPYEARNNSTRVPYLDSREYPGFQIGIGVSACSNIGNVVYNNSCGIDYKQALQKEKLPINKGLTLSEKDLLATKVIRSVVDNLHVPDNFDIRIKYSKQLDFLKKNKLIDENGKLTDDGCLFGEEIACLFFP